MLEVRNLHVHYGRIAAVRGIDLHVARGEIVALIGPNGAGKTSTLSAIVGAVKPSVGDVVFGSHSIVGLAPEAIVRHGIAMVPEGRQIFGTLSVGDNLALGLMGRRSGSNPEEDLERVLEMFPILRRFYGSSAGKLSGGEQQQLAIARALLLKPELLLLDEPSLGLAPLIVDLVFDVLDHLKAQGMTIILVEQIARRAARFADRSYVLRRGQVVLQGTRADLQATDLTEAYLGF